MKDKKKDFNGSTTTKRVKVVGTQQWLNPNTNQMEDFQVVQMEDRDFNFHKVWMRNIIMALDLIGNQKTKLAFWIVDNLNKENQLTMTYRQISEKTGISLETVRVTMKALIECNFLRRVNMGVYCVNPDVLFKGSRNGRLNVLLQYQALENTGKDTKVTPIRPEAPAKAPEVPVCPECGERLELVEVGDLAGNFVCNECNSMFTPEEINGGN